MTEIQFETLWNTKFKETIPISHLFKKVYVNRWFRIHSLPESKRYAENNTEMNQILDKQNNIISEILEENTKIYLVVGEYNWGGKSAFITDENLAFKPYKFKRIENIDLYKLNVEDSDLGEVYRPAFAETIWKRYQHDKLLKEIANDNARAFFVSFDKEIIVAPYDGGIDFVLKDSFSRDFYKQKYKNWLSKRLDGY